MSQKDIDILDDLNEQLDSPEVIAEADAARIKDPSVEVNTALADFLTKSFSQTEASRYVLDQVDAAILERLPEASFQDLMMLRHSVASDNKDTASVLLKPFTSPQSERNIIDNFKNNSTSNLADQVYNGTNDKKTLQALAYLTQILGIAEQKSRDAESKSDKEKNS